MIAPINNENSPPDWHLGLLAMLPAIRRHARIAFRDLDPENRDEAVAEVTANSLVAYVRLFELGKVDLAYPSVLARYGVAQVRDGRKVGNSLNVKDVSSPYAQNKKRFGMGRLDRYDNEEHQWIEIILEDRRSGPAAIVQAKIDIGDWMAGLSRRNRKIAEVLATGETTKAAARKFCVSAGRISQIRKELKRGWEMFAGEGPAAAAVAAA